MQHVQLGRTGLPVSRLCLGTMTFGLQCDQVQSHAILDAATEGGIDFLDTADVYPLGGDAQTVGRTEEIIGGWLKGKRHDYVLATKCVGRTGSRRWDQGMSRKHILDAIDASLKRLGTDYVDLYQLHGYDASTPIDEALEALDTVVRQGKARYIGVSNWPAYKVARGLGRSELKNLVRIDSVQPRYNLLYREIESELLPLCRDQGLGVIAYNPLAGGFLTGRYQSLEAPPPGTRFSLGKTGELYRDRYWQGAQLEAVQELQKILKPRQRSLIQVAVAWVLAQPGITSAIVGASKAEQLDESLAAVNLTLTPEEIEACNLAWFSLPRPVMPPK